jgi:hypothetical protein
MTLNLHEVWKSVLAELGLPNKRPVRALVPGLPIG